jgi:hypothetical protein
MTRRLALLVWLVVATPAAAQHAFTMDYSSGASPNAGWGTGAYTDQSTFTVTRLATGGPSGQAAYRMTIDYDGGAANFGGQFNYGWRDTLASPSQPTYGATQYYRWRMKVDSGTNYQCRDWADGAAPVNCIDKMLLVNDGCTSDPCRPILTMESDYAAGTYVLIIQKDGGDEGTTPSYQEGVWIDVQLRITWSSALGVANGSYALWIDNNSAGSPTVSVPGIIINASNNPGYTRFGSFQNHGVSAAGTFAWTHADFRTGPSFDSAWDGAGGADPPVRMPAFRTREDQP